MPGTVPGTVEVTTLDPQDSDRWVVEDIHDTSYDAAEPAIVVRLAYSLFERPPTALVRVRVRGTGSKPVMGDDPLLPIGRGQRPRYPMTQEWPRRRLHVQQLLRALERHRASASTGTGQQIRRRPQRRSRNDQGLRVRRESTGRVPAPRPPRRRKHTETQISASKGARDAAVDTRQCGHVSVGGVRWGPIVRLHAADGLFLRAEHLEAMQDYAYALSTAVGIAVGTGVVYGFELGLQDDALIATEGLALTSTGQPLQSNATLTLPLDTDHLPTLDQDDFWLVVIEPATEASGSENAYGTVCADPCEGIGSIKPWLTSLVTMRLLVRHHAGPQHDRLPPAPELACFAVLRAGAPGMLIPG